MSIWSKLFNRPEKRANVSDPVYWQDFFKQIGFSISGSDVTPDSAMKNTAVYACVRVLAETIASLPLEVYKRKKDGGKDVYEEHDLYYLLHEQPNPQQTSFEFREMMMGHLCLRGNFYAFKEMTMLGTIISLYPLSPARMRVERIQNNQFEPELLYDYTHEDGTTEKIPSKFIWHIRGLSSDGIIGLSPIQLAREAIGLGLSVEKYGAKYFANYARPGGILKYPGTLTPDALDKLKKAWEEAFTGDNAYRMAVLQGGLEWTQIGISNEDSQFLELRGFQVEDIARIFRVPCVLIGHADKTSTYASAEQFFLSFITHTIRPWVSRIEQSISKDLMTDRERKKYYVEFNLADFVRGDLESRYRAYQIAINNGWMSPNEIRAFENLNPIPEGNKYFMPTNIGEMGKKNEEKEVITDAV